MLTAGVFFFFFFHRRCEKRPQQTDPYRSRSSRCSRAQRGFLGLRPVHEISFTREFIEDLDRTRCVKSFCVFVRDRERKRERGFFEFLNFPFSRITRINYSPQRSGYELCMYLTKNSFSKFFLKLPRSKFVKRGGAGERKGKQFSWKQLTADWRAGGTRGTKTKGRGRSIHLSLVLQHRTDLNRLEEEYFTFSAARSFQRVRRSHLKRRKSHLDRRWENDLLWCCSCV